MSSSRYISGRQSAKIAVRRHFGETPAGEVKINLTKKVFRKI